MAIGTKDLNACSGIAFLGEAIILAHIAPLPPHPLGASKQRSIAPGEGEAHFERLLNVVQELYNRHRPSFSSQTTSWAIFGSFEGMVVTPEKLAIATQRFQTWGLPMRFAQYDIAKASERTNPVAGTVIGVLQNRKTYLYVEDQLKDSIDFNDRTDPTGALRSATTLSPVQSQPVHTSASASTSAHPPALGLWTYTHQQSQFVYVTPTGQRVPQAEWPQRAGRQRILLVDTRTIIGFDFDANEWFTLGTQ